jgi:hypothetical protein
MLIDAALRISRTTLLTLVACLVCSAGAASALDGIDLSAPVVPPAEGQCPRLVQIKYPFLACPSGEIGQSDADEIWNNSRHLQRQSGWTEGDGYFGPMLNPN